MKYLLIVLAAGAIVSCTNADKKAGSSAREKDSTAMAALKDTANYTQLLWQDSIHQDIGKVNEGEVVDIAWHLKNTGTKPLVIASVTPGCGCTVAEKPQEPIAPGGEGVIRAKFDSKNQGPGPHTKNVTVAANTPQHDYYLTFQVDVQKK